MKAKVIPFAVAAILLASFAYAASDAVADIGSKAAAKGGIVTAPVSLKNISNLGAADIWISYDKNIVTAESIANGDIGALAAYNIDNANGVAKMNWFSAAGKTGDFVFAYVTFKAVGEPGQKSALDITVKEMADADGAPIAHAVKAGEFSVLPLNTITPAATNETKEAIILLKDAPEISELQCGRDMPPAEVCDKSYAERAKIAENTEYVTNAKKALEEYGDFYGGDMVTCTSDGCGAYDAHYMLFLNALQMKAPAKNIEKIAKLPFVKEVWGQEVLEQPLRALAVSEEIISSGLTELLNMAAHDDKIAVIASIEPSSSPAILQYLESKKGEVSDIKELKIAGAVAFKGTPQVIVELSRLSSVKEIEPDSKTELAQEKANPQGPQILPSWNYALLAVLALIAIAIGYLAYRKLKAG